MTATAAPPRPTPPSRRANHRRRRFAELNHVLLPPTREGRDRLRHSRLGRAVAPLVRLYEALSEEGRGLFMLWLLVGAIGVSVHTTQFYLVWSGLAGAIFASVVVRRRYRLKGVTLTTEPPRRVVRGQPATFTIALRHEGSGPDHGTIRVRGPFLPWDGTWTRRPNPLAGLPRGRTATASCELTFQARGPHSLDPFQAAALVPLGLMVGPTLSGAGARFVVVPPTAPVGRLPLAPSTAAARQARADAAALGRLDGELLRGTRPYRPGDPVRHLHARSWARTGAPVIREYSDPPSTASAVFVDPGPQPTQPSDDKRLEATLSLAGGVVARLERDGPSPAVVVAGGERRLAGQAPGTFIDQALEALGRVKPSHDSPDGDGSPWRETMRALTPTGPLPVGHCVVIVPAGPDAARAAASWRGLSAQGVSVLVLEVTDASTPSTLTDSHAVPVAAVDAAVAGAGEVVL